MTDEELMHRAIALSREAALRPNCEPFGAVVARGGEIVGEGFNRSAERLDPTSHGETEAIRDACQRLGTLDLSGCEVFTSTEPCALCVATMKLTGIVRVVYAASLDDSSATLGRPKERVAVLRSEAGQAIGQASIKAGQLLRAEAVAVLAEAKARGKR